jgi:hypothetical protein
MFSSNIWHHRFRVLFALFFSLVLFIILPNALAIRLWVGTALFLLIPLLFLNKRGYLSKNEFSDLQLIVVPYARKFYFFQLIPHLLIILFLALSISGFKPFLTLLLCTWGLLLLVLSNLLEKLSVHLGEYLIRSVLVIALLTTSPFWGALLFDHIWFENWFPNLIFNLHPVPAGLSIAGKSVLQDQLMYQSTKSGLIDIRIWPTYYPILLNLLLSLILIEITLLIKKQNRSF